ALVRHHAADQLHVVMPHAVHPPCGFADYGEGFRQQRIQRRAVAEALAELVGLGPQLGIRQRLHVGLKRGNLLGDLAHARNEAVVATAEDLLRNCTQHMDSLEFRTVRWTCVLLAAKGAYYSLSDVFFEDALSRAHDE